jgi:tripeptide aminopeptidase
MDVDMRSESCAELKKLDAQFLGLVREAVEEENKSRRTKEGPIVADPRLIGDRPCGETSREHPLVQHATAAMRAFGITPGYRTGSTDANLPMSLGIPAITVARGPGGRAHSLDEWTDIDPKVSLEAAKIALATILAASGWNLNP